MGMYTEMYLALELEKDLPEEMIEYLNNASDDSNKECPIIKGMPHRLQWGIRSDSYYFDSIPTCKFHYDPISKDYYFTMVANLKNYQSEWEWLLNWLEPHIVSNGHIGHYRYEESELPEILMCSDRKIKRIYPKDQYGTSK